MLGVQLFTVRQFTQKLDDIACTLKKIAEIGYDGIEIFSFGKVDPKTIAEVIVDHGLQVAGIHVGWKRFLEDLDGIIYEQHLYRCSHAVISGLPKEYYTLEGLKKFLRKLRPLVKKLNKERIDLSYHNHSRELMRLGKKTWLDMMYEETRDDVLKAEIDTFWIQAGGGDPALWIRKCAGREALLHMKDMTIGPNGEQRFAEIGEGNMNWPDIIEASKKSGVEWYLIEQDRCYEGDPFISLSLSYRNLEAYGLSRS